MRFVSISAILMLLLLSVVGQAAVTEVAESQALTVYKARKIITMDSTNPEADVVVVRGKRIVAVGSMDDVKPWMENNPYQIDDTFADKVLMPGLIDPHLHPMLGAIQFRTHWITPETWQLHDAIVAGVTSPAAFQKSLKEALNDNQNKDELFISWGWSELYHGPVTRAMLDEIAPDRPVMIWQRSVHEGVFNSRALEVMALTEDDVNSFPQAKQVDWEKGHFIEGGFFGLVVPRLAAHLFAPEFIDPGFDRNRAYLLSRGVTTVGDMSTGAVNWDLEIEALKRNFVDIQTALRIVLVPDAYKVIAQKGGTIESAYDFINEQLTSGELPHPLVGGKRIKLFADGAMFSLLMALNPPGYVGKGQSEWITPKEDFIALARKYWNEGYQIHVHASGDAGIDFTLDVFESLYVEKPRLKNTLSLEHYGYANDRLNRRVAEFGAMVSANPFYVTSLADVYSSIGLGADRARRMTPIRGLVDRDVVVALHSDFGMAPADPFYLAWAAITRSSLSGKTMSPPGGLTLDEAMHAITIDAARNISMEKDIGSIEAGKYADFSVLEQSPYDVGVDGLRNMQIWGVVFEGRKFPSTLP